MIEETSQYHYASVFEAFAVHCTVQAAEVCSVVFCLEFQVGHTDQEEVHIDQEEVLLTSPQNMLKGRAVHIAGRPFDHSFDRLVDRLVDHLSDHLFDHSLHRTRSPFPQSPHDLAGLSTTCKLRERLRLPKPSCPNQKTYLPLPFCDRG
jgi:hypothetical protein